ncbi:hypothetical protein Zmor_015713 [Zophobas morio]|uniref:Phospholipase A2 n=1 Tax=Zophobas morio TaxID=2755281 RepID=A0AA38IK14_9CUCU|nr:hypothetical protein Zmor_015713 [Zophobas morio]
MLFKLSSVSTVLFVIVGVLAIWAQNQEYFEFTDKILKPIKFILPSQEIEASSIDTLDTQEHDSGIQDATEHISIVHDEKEHGHQDSKSRDMVRATSKKLKEIRDKIRQKFAHSEGLDLDKNLHDGKLESFKSNVQVIYPGTKWCGDGNISSSYDDLGEFAETDSCCREHDSCPDNIEADSRKHDLINTGLFTRSHCDCDRKFHQCLKDANSIISESIGYTYFTVLGPQCFREDYPIVDCIEERKGRCEKYLTDPELGDKMYQWFDNSVF